jgi:hypothetical protein
MATCLRVSVDYNAFMPNDTDCITCFWIGPYQRPVSGGAIGQDMYDLFQGNSAMENAIR